MTFPSSKTSTSLLYEKTRENSLFEANGGPKWGVRGWVANFFIKTCLITKMLAKFGGFSFISLEIKKNCHHFDAHNGKKSEKCNCRLTLHATLPLFFATLPLFFG